MPFPTAPVFPAGLLQVTRDGLSIQLPDYYWLYEQQLWTVNRQQLVTAGIETAFRCLDAPEREWASPAEAYAYLRNQVEQLQPGELGAWCIAADGTVSPRPAAAGGITAAHLVQWVGHHELYMRRLLAGPLRDWWVVVQDGAGTRQWRYPILPVNAVGSALLPPAAAGSSAQAMLHGTVVVVSPQQWASGSRKGLIVV